MIEAKHQDRQDLQFVVKQIKEYERHFHKTAPRCMYDLIQEIRLKVLKRDMFIMWNLFNLKYGHKITRIILEDD